tara:strand:+ start:32 stop:835 length:804 start_codon:yes stop_codon:yes gene_type:complete
MGKVAEIKLSNIDNFHHDDFLRSLLMGIRSIDSKKGTDNALIIRGLGGGSAKAIKRCWDTNRPFYAIDTGYFGNSKKKLWHRITHNALQNMNTIAERPFDRLELQLKKEWNEIYKPFTPGSKILVCPPSDKVMNMFGQANAAEYTATLVQKIKEITDRPVEIRMKPVRSERVTGTTIQDALRDDVHCLITYNSIAATEALMEGKPAITLGPNAAQLICETDLENIETPRIPTEDEMYAFLTHLSYAQFTQEEMKDGTAWKILQGEDV